LPGNCGTLLLALCLSFSQVSSFIHLRAHLLGSWGAQSSIAIVSLQTVHTHCVSQNSFFSITFFSSSFSPWNHFKSQVSSPRWWWRLQALHFPYPFYLTRSTACSTERLERWLISQHYWWICLKRNFCVNNMNSLTQ
jgi:hypothetical protein